LLTLVTIKETTTDNGVFTSAAPVAMMGFWHNMGGPYILEQGVVSVASKVWPINLRQGLNQACFAFNPSV
jgi:hypothetical protein